MTSRDERLSLIISFYRDKGRFPRPLQIIRAFGVNKKTATRDLRALRDHLNGVVYKRQRYEREEGFEL